MRTKKLLIWIVTVLVFTGLVGPAEGVLARPAKADPAQSVTAYDMIVAMNTLRVSYGLPPLIEDPIVMAVAQSTAEIMAANQMTWHIGDVRGRIQAAGYGGGAQVWATENFATGNMSIDEIMVVWADPDHMRPATVAAYCHVGAGIAQTSDGRYYYILQAAYTSTNSCGPYNYTDPGSGGTQASGTRPVYGVIMPVIIATPDADGKIYHEVQSGQSLWSIAIAYQITIKDIEVWNNISRNTPLRTGQRLFIPSVSTEGYATPTPVGMILPSTPGPDGKIIHSVQPYQALITIAQAYSVTVDTILALNGIQAEWPLQIDQELIISLGWVTPSPTPRPLTAVEKLTPEADGNYYHTVQSGETLGWIASLYDVPLADLMAWNGLNNASIIRTDQKLLLQVTPPATITFTPGPPTATATATRTPPPPTATLSPTPPPATPSATAAAAPGVGEGLGGWIIGIVLAAGGLVWLGLVVRKNR